MPHVLRVRAAFEQDFAEPFRKWLQATKYLRSFDIVRGIDCRIILFAKNMGEKDFPGGNIRTVMVRYSGGVHHGFMPTTVPEIKADEETTIFDGVISPVGEGPGSIEIEFTAKDGEAIECYQRRLDSPIGINQWLDIFYVVNREDLNVMWRLDRLLGWREG